MNILQRKLGLFHYNIGFFDYSSSSLMQGECPVCWMEHPYKDRFFADPFILSVSETEIKVLAEDFEYSRWKGSISLLVVDRQNYMLKRKKTLLDLDTHLSFPFILRMETNVYVIPENSASGRLTAYKYDVGCESLTTVSELTEMPVIDPVVWIDGQKYYLFGSLKGKDENEALYQWKSENALSGYRLVKTSPIKQDKSCTRRGGNFFMMNGVMHAATQCCERSYGEALNICRVEDMSNGVLRETVVSTLKPVEPYKGGLHTLNIHEGICVVDGLTFLFRPFEKMKRVLKRF